MTYLTNNNNKTFFTISLILSLFLLFTFVFGDSLQDIFVNGTTTAYNFTGDLASQTLNNSYYNGTFFLNLTFRGAIPQNMTANITNVTIWFTQIETGRIFLVNSSDNVTEYARNGLIYISRNLTVRVNTVPLPDGRYNVTINVTNFTGTPLDGSAATVINTSITNITIDNFAPAITFANGTAANNTIQIANDRIFVNVTINETTPVNVTFIFANSTTVNTTTFINYFINQSGTGVTETTLVPRNITYNFSLVGVQANDQVWTYNVTVVDQYGRQNTSLTRTLTIDGTPPTIPSITSSAGNEIQANTATTLACSVSELHPSSTILKEGSTTICSSSSTSCSASYTPTSAGDHTFTCTAKDTVLQTNSKTYTLTVTGTGVSSGGGSSGGSGGGSSSVSLGSVAAGTETNVDVSNAAAGVQELSFTSNTGLSDAKVKVSSKSEDQITSKPEQSVYKYFEVQTTNFDDTMVQTAKITFSVSERWLTQNNQAPENVVLLRLENGAWKEYPAQLVNKDNGMLNFLSNVPGFSTFAIAVRGTAGEITPSPETSSTPSTSGEQSSAAGYNTPSTSRTGLIIGLLLIVVAGVVLYFVMKKKR